MDQICFVDSMVQLTNQVSSSIFSGLLQQPSIDITWFFSQQGTLTCKVLLRKYLLRCWDLFIKNPSTQLGQILQYLKKNGHFNHDQCLFDFVYLVSYEQMMSACMIANTQCDSLFDSVDTKDLFTMCLMVLKPKLTRALQNSRHGCDQTCSKHI
jgi:hypothetical protein